MLSQLQKTIQEKKPLRYGKLACDSIMHLYKPQELPPEGAFFYHQGVFLLGVQRIYDLCGEDKYFKYAKDYIDSVIDANGEIIGYDIDNIDENSSYFVRVALKTLDNKQPAILLYSLYKKTLDKRYLKAIKTVMKSMHYWPANCYGGYWHMMLHPDQMWLDGAYMSGPMAVMYDKEFGDEKLRERAINQILLMNRHMCDGKSGLYYHGWDASKEVEWADKATGLSAAFWGRAVGWYAVAILDMLDYIDKSHPQYDRLIEIELDLLRNLAAYQDKKTGLWFQVLDKIDRSDNWIESSCSSLFIYAYAKAIRTGIADEESFAAVLDKAYNGMIDSTYYDDNGYLVIDNICVATCIDEGSYDHYINRPTTKNDLHGVGAFVLMCSEMEKLKRRVETE